MLAKECRRISSNKSIEVQRATNPFETCPLPLRGAEGSLVGRLGLFYNSFFRPIIGEPRREPGCGKGCACCPRLQTCCKTDIVREVAVPGEYRYQQKLLFWACHRKSDLQSQLQGSHRRYQRSSAGNPRPRAVEETGQGRRQNPRTRKMPPSDRSARNLCCLRCIAWPRARRTLHSSVVEWSRQS